MGWNENLTDYKYIPGNGPMWQKNNQKIQTKSDQSFGCRMWQKFSFMKCWNSSGLIIHGFDISNYALKRVKKNKNLKVFKYKAEKKFPYKKKSFDLVISLATLHNLKLFDLANSIKEIERVGKKKYIMVESFTNDKQLFNLQCWALTCQTFLSVKEWKWLYKKMKYKGDYEFIFFN